MLRLFFLFLFSSYSALFSGEPLQRLMDGHNRYLKDLLEHPDRTAESRKALISKQEPFAIIVGCSDSRVPPEILFDQGLGDLFVVRVAGNVVGPIELASVEYAALYLKSKVILVMGHQNCGAVNAVVQGTTKDIEPVAKLIRPAFQAVKKESPSNLLDACIKRNALNMKEVLQKNSVIGKLIKEGKVEVEAAYYSLETGAVELL